MITFIFIFQFTEHFGKMLELYYYTAMASWLNKGYDSNGQITN